MHHVCEFWVCKSHSGRFLSMRFEALFCCRLDLLGQWCINAHQVALASTSLPSSFFWVSLLLPPCFHYSVVCLYHSALAPCVASGCRPFSSLPTSQISTLFSKLDLRMVGATHRSNKQCCNSFWKWFNSASTLNEGRPSKHFIQQVNIS